MNIFYNTYKSLANLKIATILLFLFDAKVINHSFFYMIKFSIFNSILEWDFVDSLKKWKNLMEYHYILSFKVTKLHILRDIEFTNRSYSFHIGRLFSTNWLRPFLESPFRYPSIIKLCKVMIFVTYWFSN